MPVPPSVMLSPRTPPLKRTEAALNYPADDLDRGVSIGTEKGGRNRLGSMLGLRSDAGGHRPMGSFGLGELGSSWLLSSGRRASGTGLCRYPAT